MQTKPSRRCDQSTARGYRCERVATWLHTEADGTVEGYCTQHASIYDPGGRLRRLGGRWATASAPHPAERADFEDRFGYPPLRPGEQGGPKWRQSTRVDAENCATAEEASKP